MKLQNVPFLLTGIGSSSTKIYTSSALLSETFPLMVNFCVLKTNVSFIEGDIRDEIRLSISLNGCDAVIHFAGLKAVGESVEQPSYYYDNNVNGTLCLLNAMSSNNIKKLVFSSSATVYGNPQALPLTENHPLNPTNPYGRTKRVIEDLLQDVFMSDPLWSIFILRYFNHPLFY